MLKRNYILSRVISEIPLNVSADALDLSGWIHNLSDVEYQECAKGHFGAGTSILPDGTRTSINVESVGGHFIVQHYKEEISEKNHIKLVSESSDLWLYHVFHIHAKVTWDMTLVPSSENSCILRNRIVVEHPSIFIKIGSIIGFVPFFIKKHDEEETQLFAESLLRTLAT